MFNYYDVMNAMWTVILLGTSGLVVITARQQNKAKK